MKILLFTDSLGSGGAQRQLVGLAVLLKSQGHQVKVCTYHNKDFFKSYLDENGIDNEVIPGACNKILRIPYVCKYFILDQSDCIIAYQETPSLVACIAKLLGCKSILIVSERNTTQKVGLNERVRFALYHYADAIVPNSNSQEKWLRDHYPWMSKKITTITNFVDLDLFHYVEHYRKATPVIVVAASIVQSKNALGLIRAVKILSERCRNFVVEWYGLNEDETQYYRECFSLIEQLSVSEYIHLLPKTKEINIKLQEADYFCLPSLYEGTPNVICEAIASGLPVMCSNICDNPQYVREGFNGILFDPSSPQDIALSIEKLMEQTDEMYQVFCRNSRALAEQKLSPNVFLAKYLNLILNEFKE